MYGMEVPDNGEKATVLKGRYRARADIEDEQCTVPSCHEMK